LVSHTRLFYYITILFAFCIPVHDRLALLFAVLMLLNWIFTGNFRTRFKQMVRSRKQLPLLLFTSLFFIYTTGLFWTKNMHYGIVDLELKVPLLLFPFIFATSRSLVFRGKRVINIFLAYMAGCFFSTMIFIFNAFSNFIHSNSYDEFYYTKLAIYQHTTYMSMFLCLAIAMALFLLLFRKQMLSRQVQFFTIGLIPYYFILVVLLSSKAGIFCMGLIFVASIVAMLLYGKKKLHAVVAFAFVFAAFAIAQGMFPNSFGRMKVVSKTISSRPETGSDAIESTAERVLIWDAALGIIKKNFVAGVGTGDVKDALFAQYEMNNFKNGTLMKLNAHNQYLQTFIALGLSGILILLAGFIWPLWFSIKKSYLIYVSFIIIVGFNFLFESMLERQAGMMFYAFFNAFFFTIKEELRVSRSPSV
jgi:O-antigen ligase